MQPTPIEVFSDVACPFCFIGKRSLDALARRCPVSVRWRAFELWPGLPPGGVDARPVYLRRFGGEGAMRVAFQRVVDMGAGVGIAFDLDRLTRAPNTRMAHRAIALATEAGAADAAVEALFLAHFTEGADIGGAEEIVAALQRHRVPLDPESTLAALSDGGGAAAVEADLALARELGVGAVPLYVAGGHGLMGAVPVEALERLVEAAAPGSGGPPAAL